MPEPGHGPEPVPLGTFLRDQRGPILQEWADRTRALPPAQQLSGRALLDHFGQLLDVVAEVTEGSRPGITRIPEQHALQRLSEGFALEEVAHEYSTLRAVVLERYRTRYPALPVDDLLRFNRALDSAITLSVSRFMKARARSLEALDRISAAALRTMQPDELLESCLGVLVHTMEVVDSAVVLLTEDGTLRVRAAVGLLEERDARFTLRIGEGFAGTIAQTRKPLFLASAATDPLVKSEFIRKKGLRALYGVPLLDGEELIGVAHIGSLSADHFSEEDLLVFRQAASRLSTLLHHAQLRDNERAARERAQLAESQLRGLLESISDGFLSLDAKWRVVYANAQALRLANRTPETLLGAELFQAIPRIASLGLRERLEDVKARQEPAAFELEVPTMQRWFEVRAFPSDGGVAFTFHEITRRRREAEARERRLAEHQGAEKFQTRLMGIVGHDLRNPLQAILMSARVLIQRGEIADSAVPGLLRIQRSADRMAQIINDLLDFTRARIGGGIPLAPRPADLASIVRGILEELEVTHPGRLLLDADGDDTGEWDAGRLGQVVSNLVSNALSYGAHDRPVRIRLRAAPAEVELTVANEGDPIPEDVLPHIFDPFRRADPERHEGLGLGLYIVEQIVVAHAGRIAVRSDARGTVFTVTLPRQTGTGASASSEQARNPGER